MSGEHHRQPGPQPRRREFLYLFADFCLDLRRDFRSVENDGRHDIDMPLTLK